MHYNEPAIPLAIVLAISRPLRQNVNNQRENPKRPLFSINRLFLRKQEKQRERERERISASSREIRSSGVEKTGVYFSDVDASIYHVTLSVTWGRGDAMESRIIRR